MHASSYLHASPFGDLAKTHTDSQTKREIDREIHREKGSETNSCMLKMTWTRKRITDRQTMPDTEVWIHTDI